MTQGSLQTKEGNKVHFGFSERFIEAIEKSSTFEKRLAFDRRCKEQITKKLKALGFLIVMFGKVSKICHIY